MLHIQHYNISHSGLCAALHTHRHEMRVKVIQLNPNLTKIIHVLNPKRVEKILTWTLYVKL